MLGPDPSTDLVTGPAIKCTNNGIVLTGFAGRSAQVATIMDSILEVKTPSRWRTSSTSCPASYKTPDSRTTSGGAPFTWQSAKIGPPLSHAPWHLLRVQSLIVLSLLWPEPYSKKKQRGALWIDGTQGLTVQRVPQALSGACHHREGHMPRDCYSSGRPGGGIPANGPASVSFTGTGPGS